MSIASVQAAESTATEMLIAALERARPRLKWIFFSFRLGKEDAEDLLQDLALLALRKIPEIENLDTWLPAAAHYLCMGLHRTRYRERTHLPRIVVPTHRPAHERVELRLDLKRALTLLPPRLRQVIVLKAMGFTGLEISYRTGCHSGSISKIADQGIVSLTERLGSRSPHRIQSGRPLRLKDSTPSLPAPSPATLLKLLARTWERPGTRRSYLYSLGGFAAWFGREDTGEAIAELLGAGEVAAQETVLRYRKALVQKNLAVGTVNLHLVALRAVVRLAGEHGLVNWQLDVPGLPQRARNPNQEKSIGEEGRAGSGKPAQGGGEEVFRCLVGP